MRGCSSSNAVLGDGKRETGKCILDTTLDVHAQHKRSRSASEWNWNVAKDGVLRPLGKDLSTSDGLPPTERSHRGKSPLPQESNGCKSGDSSNHRASLEKDIEDLHSRLQQEKSVRVMLERAMGRASSTLSPGHRHVATQTKELIAEIELLEEEVASREQHVLSLYRSIFEQCVSTTPSQQSSGMTSPAHTKNEARKHPSIISSSFCSSKNLPLQPFQVLVSMKGYRKRNASLQSKSRHSSLLSGQSNIATESSLDPSKVYEKVPIVEKTSFTRTLKDHLFQCPSKLSEELVRCMAAVYCWVQTAESTKLEKKCSPLLSRSSTNVILPRRGSKKDKEWSCRSTLDISWISTDKSQFSHASYAINSYRYQCISSRLNVECLHGKREELSTSRTAGKSEYMSNGNGSSTSILDQRVQFSHYACKDRAYLAYGIPQGSLRRVALFHKAAYNIGGHVISVNTIEQSIFCTRNPRIGRWFEAIISTAMRKKSGENKQVSSKFALQNSPLLCFALCTGASSDPVLKVYTATNIKEQLEVAMKEFLQANVVVKKSRKVFLPKLLERYAKEACLSSDDLLNWVAENVDNKLQDSIKKCVDCYSKKKKASLILDWLPYNTRFQYKFAKDLTEKPWWV
ncbi:hypothetical protein IFM89_033268 [Coptis chinensis]|uniref:Ternary complex factor MIP1 leucine-zipper domain-containing protein n=1 Tax=Coptis chinensis TaxID=261450 RepID=A0A835IIM3_9MAGN|nr:hypothetical protein IFM89_033268 [Coptis chinensis]